MKQRPQNPPSLRHRGQKRRTFLIRQQMLQLGAKRPRPPARRTCFPRGCGNVPARHCAINRSNRARIRAIRPHTATSKTVNDRSRAATAAIAACRSERIEEKLNMSVN